MLRLEKFLIETSRRVHRIKPRRRKYSFGAKFLWKFKQKSREKNLKKKIACRIKTTKRGKKVQKREKKYRKKEKNLDKEKKLL